MMRKGDWSDDYLVHAYGNTFMECPKRISFSISSADLIHATIYESSEYSL